MRQMIKGAGVVCASVLAFGLAACLGADVPVAGWLLWYMTGLALVSAVGFAAWASE